MFHRLHAMGKYREFSLLATILSLQVLEPAFQRELVLLDGRFVGLIDVGPAACDFGVDVAALLDEGAEVGNFGGL